MSAYYNDNDAYCCRVLRKNIAAGHLPPGDVDERDIRDVQPDDLVGYTGIHLFAGIGGLALACRLAGLSDGLNICTGGFPCQDISLAGRGAAINGERSGLWAEMARLLGGLRPCYVLVENSPALLGRGMGRVLGDLAACGYDAEWDCVSAASVGAPHIRDRVFILAHADGPGCAQQWRAVPGAASDAAPERGGDVLSDASRRRHRPSPREIRSGRDRPEHSSWWRIEPAVGRMAARIPHRVDRLRGLGNAVVPQAAAVALRRIAAIEQERPE